MQLNPHKKVPLILVRGLPGSGKSWFANKLHELLQALGARLWESVPVFETDEFFYVNDGTYSFDRDLVEVAHNWNLGRVIMHCRKHPTAPVIVANTFCEWKEIKPYFNVARMFKRWLVVMEMTNELGSEHDGGGTFTNVHGVPEDVISNMRARFNHGLDTIKVNKDNWEAVCRRFIGEYWRR